MLVVNYFSVTVVNYYSIIHKETANHVRENCTAK